MTHPYRDSQSIRYSPRDIIEMMLDKGICSCGSHDLSHKQIETHPFDSTADEVTCNSCGRVWEMAYEIKQAMCVLREPAEKPKPQLYYWDIYDGFGTKRDERIEAERQIEALATYARKNEVPIMRLQLAGWYAMMGEFHE